MNLFEKMILTPLAAETKFSDIMDIDEFEYSFFLFDWEKTNMNDNLTKLNLGFERSKLLRTK